MNEDLPEGKELVQVDDLTKAQINAICADLLAKAEAYMAKAEEVRRYWESLRPEVKMLCADMRDDLDKTSQELREAAIGHVAHMRELREYWESKHPEQTL